MEKNILNEVIFEGNTHGFYLEEFIHYEMTFHPTPWGYHINYSYSTGKMYEGQGAISIFENNIQSIHRTCGVSGCSSVVSENGKLVHRTFEEVNRW